MTTVMEIPRFRFAFHPADIPHIGHLHSAAFAWALARAQGGDFILRLDGAGMGETESGEEMVDALNWLGLDWDEGPGVGEQTAASTQQRQRGERYQELAETLVARGKAAYRDDLGGGRSLRLLLPEDEPIVVEDALRGPLRFEVESLPDTEPLLVSPEGAPSAYLTSVVDDQDMEISHVVQDGESLLTVPFQVALYRALGWEPPTYVHVPVIKREADPVAGARPLFADEFQEAGYLPEALFNYLLLLGWSPEEEIFGRWEVRRNLTLDAISAEPVTFDWQRLNRINRHHINEKSDKALSTLIRPYLADAYGLTDVNEAWLQRLTAVIRPEIVRLADAVHLAEWALADFFTFTPEAEAALEMETTRPALVRLVAELARIVLLDVPTATTILDALKRDLSSPEGSDARVEKPIRAALTGRLGSASLAEIMALLGAARCMNRAADILRGA
ncbi:MAG: glutamate--tRNA ligase family protein [Candidatus Promineifilaceae bacterium]|nr:glutamate--tRNA ligase family protein [Candidatus Promineifilaceae bacterium]